jgi:hypothetical protein
MYSYLKCIVYDKLLKHRQSFWIALYIYVCMCRIKKFRSTTERIYDGGHIILFYNTYYCITIAYSIQYSNMLYRFVA